MIMSGRLHQLMSADPRALADCRAFLQPGDEVLLVDAGVHLLTDSDALFARLQNKDFTPRVSALRSDILSRGLEAATRHGRISLLSDAQWVERVFSSSQVLSWK